MGGLGWVKQNRPTSIYKQIMRRKTMSTRSAARAPISANGPSLVQSQHYFRCHIIFHFSLHCIGTLLVFRSQMYMNILENIICIVYDDVFSLSVFLSKPRALKTRVIGKIRRH